MSVAVKAETGFTSLMLIFLVLPSGPCINKVCSFMVLKILKSETNLVLKVPFKWFFTAINWPTLKSYDLKFLLHWSVSVFNNLFYCKFLACECHNFLNLAKSIKPFSLPIYLVSLKPSSLMHLSRGSLPWIRKNGLLRSSDVGVELKQ